MPDFSIGDFLERFPIRLTRTSRVMVAQTTELLPLYIQPDRKPL